MLAATCTAQSADDPLSGLTVGDRPEPEVPQGWARVTVRAASLNHHDLWSLKGVGLPADRLPMVLGCDAAGVTDDGDEVVVHAIVGDPDWSGDETLDPKRSILSERHQGTFAEQVVVPRRNLVPKPAELSFEQAACLPTAWLTAYRMLFTQAGVSPGRPGAGAGRRRRRLDRRHRARPRGRARRLGDRPRRGQARAGARARRARGLRARRPAARPGRRRPRDGRQGHLGPLDEEPAPRRHARRVGRDDRRRPVGRPQPAVLPAAAGPRLDDGHAPGARGAAAAAGRHRRAPAGRRGACRCPRPRGASSAWWRGTSSARSS